MRMGRVTLGHSCCPMMNNKLSRYIKLTVCDVLNKSFCLKWAEKGQEPQYVPWVTRPYSLLNKHSVLLHARYHSGDILQYMRIGFKLALFYTMRNFYLESLLLSQQRHNRAIAGHLLISRCCPRHGKGISL